MSDSDQWDLWCRWFDRAVDEMHGALHTRWMWRALSGIIDESGIKKNPYLLNYFSHTYAATVCAFVRRQASDDRHDAGLARCLRLLIRNPGLATRDLYAERGAARHDDPDWDEDGGFDTYAPKGGDRIERAVLEASLARLQAAAAPVKKYVDTAIAHTSHSALLEPVEITFDDIDHALDEVEAVVMEYYGLRNPGVMLAFGTPIADLSFLRMFEEPWLNKGSPLPASVRDY